MNYEIFDYKMIERNFADMNGAINVDALAKCEEVFNRVVDARMEKLSQAIQAKNAKDVEMTAHQLKGSFLVLGGDALAQRCLTLERGAGTLSVDAMAELEKYVKENLPKFQAEVARAIQSLKMAARPTA